MSDVFRTTHGSTVILALLCMSGALGGCSTTRQMAPTSANLARTHIVTPQERAQLERSMTDKDIAAMLDVDIKAKLPTHLAVAKLQDEEQTIRRGRFRHNAGNLSLCPIPQRELDGWDKAVSSQASIQGVKAITPISQDSQQLSIHSLRSAAARMGCELLLVYLQADGTVDNFNDAAALYWTVVGLWTVPGNTYEHKTVMQAALVDCRTGMILGTAGGEAHMKTSYAAVYEKTAKGKIDEEAPPKAMEELMANSVKMVAQVVRDAATARKD